MSRTSASKPIAFISYSIKDKKYGAAVREALNALNVESFLAHNDLRVSDKWEKKILKEVGRCNVFVPLLSKNFLKSEWCSQETGIIVKRRGVTIFPLLLDGTMPFGFIRHVQGQRVTLEEIDEKLFLRPLAEKISQIHITAMDRTSEEGVQLSRCRGSCSAATTILSRAKYQRGKSIR